MLIVLAIALGALIGWRRAVARGGDRLDKLHYATVHAIALGLVVAIGLVVIGRLSGA